VWQVLGALTSAEASACLASGAVSSNVSGGPKTLTGRGAFAECDAGVRRVLSSFDRAGQPKPQRGQRFVAMSLFFYSINFARLAGHLAPSMATTPRALLDAASALCRESDALRASVLCPAHRRRRARVLRRRPRSLARNSGV